MLPVVMVFNAIFNNISFISWKKPEHTEKTTDMSQVNGNLDHIYVLYSTPSHVRGSNSQL